MKILDNSYVFLVDSENLFFGARNNNVDQGENPRIDFKALKEIALAGRSFAHSYFKVYASMRMTSNVDYFTSMLKRNGYFYEIAAKKVTPAYTQSRDMDVLLAVEAVTYRIDGYLPSIVSIASGDADFIPVYKYLQSHGVSIEIVSFPACLAREVKQMADEVILLDKRVTFNEQVEESTR